MESKRRRPKAWTCALWSAIFLVSIVVFMHTTAMAQSIGSPEQFAAQLREVIAAQAIGDEAARDKLAQINNTLRAQGLNIAIEAIQFLTLGKGRPDIRMHQEGRKGEDIPWPWEGIRWVPGDVRRNLQPQGNNLTYFDLFSLNPSLLPPGVSIAQAQGAVDAAMSTWANDNSLKKLPINFIDEPGFGVFGLGDITHFGWTSLSKLGIPASDIVAATLIYIFTDLEGVPTDINGDHYFDTATAQVFYNTDNNFSWGINAVLPSFDIQSVVLHEAGHAIGIGHFGYPPICVMNPVYGGIKQTLFPIDSAGMSTLYGSWPNP